MSDAVVIEKLARHPNHIRHYPAQNRYIVVQFRLVIACHPTQLSCQKQGRHRHYQSHGPKIHNPTKVFQQPQNDV